MPATRNALIKNHLILIAGLVITTLVYSKFIFYGHISWDDPEMVFRNNAVKNFDLQRLFTGHFVGNYIPVTMLLHAINWQLFTDSSAGHHVVNILLHLCNGFFVYRLGKKLFKDELIPNMGMIVFLLHPLQIESVGWISELKNVLSTTFFLAGTLQYLRFRESGKTLAYLSAFFLFVLGTLSKSSVVVFPLALLCLDIINNQKLRPKIFLDKIPFLVVSIILGLINIQTQTADQFINHAHEFPFYQRLSFAGFALLKYLLLFIAPVNLSLMYPYPEQKTSVLIFGFLLSVFFLAGLIFLFKRKQMTWLGVLLFIFINLVLVLQFLPFGEVLYADRYLYVPIIGFGWLAGICISPIKLKPQIAAGVFIALYSVFSFARINVWKSSISLYEDIIKKYPTHFVALNSAGVESMFNNDDEKSLEYLNRAVIAAPNNYKGFYNRGLLFLKNQRPQEAIRSFNEALNLYQYSKAYTGRASAYYLINDISKAMQDARSSILLEEKNPRAHFVLGNCYNDLNQIEQAVFEYTEAIKLDREDPDFYFKRAIAYGKLQDFLNCIQDLEVCLKFNPDYHEAYYWRGVAKVNLKQDPCPDLEKAARQNFEPAVIAFNKYCR